MSPAPALSRQLQVPQDPEGRRQDLRIFLAARCREERPGRHLQAALLPQGADREPAAARGRPLGQGRRHPRRGRVAEDQDLHARDRLPPGARADAGLHRRARRRRPGRHARRHEGTGRRSRPRSTRWCRSTSSSTIPCRSTTSARPTPSKKNVEIEYERNKERYEFLRWGAGAFNNFRVVPPGHRHLPPGQSRVSGADRVDQGRPDRRRPFPIPASAPTATPPWSTRWACSAGASAASRRRRPCWASRSPW